MKKNNRENMYSLIRELMDVLGIARSTIMALEGFIESIRQLKSPTEEIEGLYLELADAIKNSQPNIIPLMHLLEQFEEEMEQKLNRDMSSEEIGRIAIASLQEKVEQFKNNARMVTSHGLKFVDDGDVIIVHSASSVVLNILLQAKEEHGKKFSVIILDHNPARTSHTIRVLRRAEIEHTVVPAHNLSHHLGGANKMFVGGMTITTDRQIVAPTGTAGTVTLCHYNDIKLHLFANSLHYSGRDAEAQCIYKGTKNGRAANLDFTITTHSHDLVSLDLFDHVVTEKGETPKVEC